jgi:hypothetical protein
MITLLRNAALNAMQYKAELALARSQSVDITNFEQNLKIFQEGFSKTTHLHQPNFLKRLRRLTSQ